MSKSAISHPSPDFVNNPQEQNEFASARDPFVARLVETAQMVIQQQQAEEQRQKQEEARRQKETNEREVPPLERPRARFNMD
jgi:hypothetical protein